MLHRHFALSCLAGLFFLTSCEVKFDWAWNKPQNTPTPSPAQPTDHQGTVTDDRTVGTFDKVKLEGLGQLVFDPAIPQGTVRVRADQDNLAKIRTTVEGSRLVLKEEGMGGDWDLEFRVAPPQDLAEVTLAGLGSVESLGPLKTASPFTIALDGMGKVSLEIEAKVVVLNQKGQGELAVRGTAESATIRADGVGKVNASALKVSSADVTSNGVGEVEVFASESLKVRANGLGAVHFSGHPAKTDVQTKGLTQVSAAD